MKTEKRTPLLKITADGLVSLEEADLFVILELRDRDDRPVFVVDEEKIMWRKDGKLKKVMVGEDLIEAVEKMVKVWEDDYLSKFSK